LPGVEAATRYAGWPVLKLGGAFMAGLASHYSAEPETAIVRIALDDRNALLEDAPDTYYVTDYYQPHPVVRSGCHTSIAMRCTICSPCRSV
jgi:hypothetical protein